MKRITIIFILVSLAGCMPGLRPDKIVKHPDAPMLIQETKSTWFGGPYARVAIYDKTENRLIDYGWIDLATVQGWSLQKYDWEAFIERRRGSNGP